MLYFLRKNIQQEGLELGAAAQCMAAEGQCWVSSADGEQQRWICRLSTEMQARLQKKVVGSCPP